MDPADNEYRAQRMENMRRQKELGYGPFGGAFRRTGRLADVRAAFKENDTAAVAGRIVAWRDMGKAVFADIHDGSDRFQLYAQKKQLGDTPFDAFRLLDVGDHIGIEGTMFVTRMGEQTLRVDRWALLAKALLPLPEKWHGLKDVETRYRERHLDLIANQSARDLFEKRSRAIREIRRFLDARGFREVETPMMQPQAGGAAARPFVTRFDALATDMYMRIAPELYLKRLLVGGFDKVYEMGKCFRNEGLDRTHCPEFTMLEIYEAYSDMRGMKELVQSLVAHVAGEVFGTLKFGEGESAIDLTPPWREADYRVLVRQAMGPDWFELPLPAARDKAKAAGIEVDPAWDMCALTQEAYEKTVERTLIQPTFVINPPSALVPLAKSRDDDPATADVFELEIGGREIAPGYSELNDPLEQRRRLEAQAGGQKDKIDEEFLSALEHGMPPAGGMGIGVDRLLMLLCNAEAIRDVILFPQLRPRQQ